MPSIIAKLSESSCESGIMENALRKLRIATEYFRSARAVSARLL